jgi:hypothetical protein
MNNFEQLKKKKFILEDKKKTLNIHLKLIEDELKDCKKNLYSKCIEEGGHYFHRECDYQLYGEVTLTCTNCGLVK